jgi:DNA-binding GntR family transcriptional regulator
MQLRVRNRMRQTMREHRDIVAALKAGDAEQAERMLRDHIAVQGERFTDLMAHYGEEANKAGAPLVSAVD